MKVMDIQEMQGISGGESDLSEICMFISLIGVFSLNPVVIAMGIFCTFYDLGSYFRNLD